MLYENRNAKFNYFIEETFEAGLALKGDEVKQFLNGKFSFDGFISIDGTIKWMKAIERDIPLLLNKSEIRKLIGAVSKNGYTIVPLKVYLSDSKKIKVEIALAKGKKLHDKRQAIKEREQEREKECY